MTRSRVSDAEIRAHVNPSYLAAIGPAALNGQRRVDTEWPRPRNTRHCWVLRGRSAPVQGFVVAWRRHSYRYSALVVYVDQTPEGQDRLVQLGIPAEQLRPVRSDPNEAIRHSGFSELLRRRRVSTRTR